MEMSVKHKENVKNSFKCAVLTISSSRYEKYGSTDRPERAEDASGKLIWGMMHVRGCEIVHYELVPDNLEMIKEAFKKVIYSDADIIISSGGTGLSPSDVTIEAVNPFFEKEIPGFGELFRYKSLAQVGNSVMLTRAVSGVARGKVIFCLPGSPNAVKLAMELILPEMGHFVKHIRGE